MAVSENSGHAHVQGQETEHRTDAELEPESEPLPNWIHEKIDLEKKEFPLTQGELGAVVSIFAMFALALSIIYLTMPTVDYQVLKLPHNVDEVRLLTKHVNNFGKISSTLESEMKFKTKTQSALQPIEPSHRDLWLNTWSAGASENGKTEMETDSKNYPSMEYVSGYAKDYTLQVVLGYFVTYIFMQTFMIPGTIFMSLLGGSLFGISRGLLLVIITATSGASSCYFLSKMVGRPIAYWLWPEKLNFFSSEVAKRKKSLLNYMLFLRITPTLPNTFINFASPIVDVPYHTFFLATFFGLIPAAFVTVRAGLALNDINSVTDLYDAKTLGTLFLIGVVSIVPTWAEKIRARASEAHHLHVE